MQIDGVRAATYDGDTPGEEREWVRSHATFVLTNPDMLHHSLLPGHPRWAAFLKSLRYVVVDEVHAYRGLFGSHVSAVLRRLQRVAERYDANPTFILASATVAQPDVTAGRLIGRQVEAVTDDASPRGPVTFALWEPPLSAAFAGEHGAPVRRTATAESADLLGDLVSHGRRALVFVRSRRGAESVALLARGALADVDPALPSQVAAYRAGFLPEERRLLERRLKDGRLRGLASTTALELGVDISGLDAVVLAGWPGTRASLWQQAGRAGRDGSGALAVLVARDDPLDTYLVHHPDAVFGAPAEATVLDPDNPYVLAPHLCAAAAELALTPEDLPRFGPTAATLVEELVQRGYLRRRSSGWYWTRRERATDLADLRGIGGRPVRVVESGTGRLLGTVDPGSADSTVHAGAVYVHQGEGYLVDDLDLDDAVALVHAADPEYTTTAREVTSLDVVETLESTHSGGIALHFGTVEVTHQVVSFLRRRFVTAEVLGEESLDLPVRTLQTKAVWWTMDDAALAHAELAASDVPGALHAAEHASIGLLPLFATCDRWDIGGVSTPPPRRHRVGDRLRVRRPSRRRRLRRAGIRRSCRLAAGHPGRDHGLCVPDRLSLLHPVPEVRERQRAARQGRRGAGADGRSVRSGHRPGHSTSGVASAGMADNPRQPRVEPVVTGGQPDGHRHGVGSDLAGQQTGVVGRSHGTRGRTRGVG